MAYGLKFTLPWKDVDNNQNLVEIYQADYVGSSTELIATDVPAIHKLEREDNEDIVSPIMSTTLTISFYSTDTINFSNFFSYSDREFLVIYKFGNAIVPQFKGYLLNDITGEPFQDPPYPVVLTATDGLAQLKEITLTGPTVDTDLGQLLFAQLNSLALELDFEICNDLYEGLVQDNTTSIFNQAVNQNLLIQKGTFDELNLNAYDFLKEICRSMGWVLFQKRARWVFQRPIYGNRPDSVRYVHSHLTGALTNTFVQSRVDQIGDQEDINTSWTPVNSDQLIQYQRPIKKLTVIQGDLGQSVISNGEKFQESSWQLEGTYKPIDWTVVPDAFALPSQIYPKNIPAQSSYDNEEGVSWDIRFMPDGISLDQPIISKPVFLDFAGLSLNLEIDIDFLTSASALAIDIVHEDSEGNIKYLGISSVSGQSILTWSASNYGFVHYATKNNDSRLFKLTSFVLPTAGFLSVRLKYYGTTGSVSVRRIQITPIFDGEENPKEVKKIYETARNYTTTREETLKFSDVVITNSKNWMRIGEFPAIVFVEKSLADIPDIIQVPSGAVTQVDQLTDSLVSNSLSFSGGVINGSYTRNFVSSTGFTIDNIFVTLSSLSGTPPQAGVNIQVTVSTISSTEKNVTITFIDYDYSEQGNIQIQVYLKDSNNNPYQTSTFLFQTLSAGTFTYTQTNITFSNQALLGGYSPTLRDCFGRNILSVYNTLSYRLEGSFRRKDSLFGSCEVRHTLNYSGYTNINLGIIGWEYDLASRVAKVIFGQIPDSYTYPIN